MGKMMESPSLPFNTMKLMALLVRASDFSVVEHPETRGEERSPRAVGIPYKPEDLAAGNLYIFF
ncbi:hypothetical protein [Oleiagrimonas sp. C23AA]|uniref:hypothetical protein n=1 Tax=Oleiagrimonas sp. C23AA TaxID=2719047 RepID=UPI00141F3AEA|nr:hypothetical protein [Oleiagrimonas sp. C23AA]NII10579.1 hypothetical protein [Oleiagrimonas sp. C23AA]